MAKKKAEVENGTEADVVLLGFKVTPELNGRLRNTAWHCRLTISQILTAGLYHVLEALEAKHNRGNRFGKPRPTKEIEL